MTKPIIVTVREEALAKIDELAAELGAKGMQVERVLPITGVISGSSADAVLAALREVDGVLSVEEEAVAQLPPPGSKLQ